jgi:hypothetical protein
VGNEVEQTGMRSIQIAGNTGNFAGVIGERDGRKDRDGRKCRIRKEEDFIAHRSLGVCRRCKELRI